MVQADPRLDAAGLLEVAERMVDRGEGAPGELTPEDRRRLAWMLKDVCDAAWSSEPQRAARAADAVRRLLGTTDAPDAPEADEIGAVAAWTAGIAHLTRGEMGSALTCLDEAAHAFRARGEAHRVAETQVSKIVALA